MIDAFKREFSLRSYGALNNAGISPISQSAATAVNTWTGRMQREGIMCYFAAEAEIEKTRSALGQLLGASPEQIAFFQTCATALSQVALGLPLKAGDEILIWDQEYPSNFYPWVVAARRSGAKLVVVKSDEGLRTPTETMIKNANSRTKIMAFSWVQYRTGQMADIKAITAYAKPRGIFTCADIIQGAGVIPFDFSNSGLDAACGGAHKWLLSPLGVGFLLLSREQMQKLEPLSVGALSFGTTEEIPRVDARLKETMGRFEPGAKNVLELVALGAALKLLNETGMENIYQEARRLSKSLTESLHALGYVIHSPGDVIVNFSPDSRVSQQSISDIAEHLTQANIAFGVRPPGIRLSPHAFNSQADIDAVIKALS